VADETELPGTFAGENASPSMRRAIRFFGVAYTLATLAVLPLAHLPGPVVPAVTTTFGAGVLIADLCTSFLLLVQFRVAPSWSMLLLAAAYFYSGTMACLHVLTFPGAWIPDAVLVGTPQSVGWLFICWILGYPTLVLTAIVAEARFRNHRMAAEGVNHTIAMVFGIVLVVLVALTLATTTGPSWMPQQLQGHVFTSWSNTAQWTSVGITMAAFVALALVTRGRNVLYGWLGLALIAFMAFNALAVAGGGAVHDRLGSEPDEWLPLGPCAPRVFLGAVRQVTPLLGERTPAYPLPGGAGAAREPCADARDLRYGA